MLVAAVVLCGQLVFAGASNDWVRGSFTASVMSQNIHPTLSMVKYPDPQVQGDLWLDLPAGYALQLQEYAGLNGGGFDNDKGDEFDLGVWKKFALDASTYLKLRLKYVDSFPVSEVEGDDPIAYDVFIGRSFNHDGPNTVTAELRAEYWHYIREGSEGMVSVIPSLSHEYRANARFAVYDQLVLQWNNEMDAFGELLSAQAKAGVKVKLTNNLNWNVVDVWGILPLTKVADGDPRAKNDDGAVAVATALALRL